MNAAGFYTQEIRHGKVRKGFSWIRLDGRVGTLAHVDIKGRFKVGKYGVDIAGFEKAILPILDIQKSDTELFVIDEIGKMECFSDKFVSLVRLLFHSEKMVLATVAAKGVGLISEVKKKPNVKLFQLRHQKQEKVVAEIIDLLSSC